MSHETEAACLVRTGNLYPRRAGLSYEDGRLVFAGIKHGAFSIYDGDDPHVHLDLEGRWQRAYIQGTHYRKALDGSVAALDRERTPDGLVLRRRAVSFAESADLDDLVRAIAVNLLADLGAGRAQVVPPPAGAERALGREELTELLERAAGWDADAWFRHRERYLKAYVAPIDQLPPDAHATIVLQATLGGGEPARAPSAFEAHAREVAALLGRRTAQARGLFLGGGDVLGLPVTTIGEYLAAASRVFPIGGPPPGPGRPSDRDVEDVRLADVAVAMDRPEGPRPDARGWVALREGGLGRVTIDGLDPSRPEPLVAVIGEIKAAGLPVGLRVTAAMAVADLDGVAAVLGRLDLAAGDLVFLTTENDAADLGPLIARLRTMLQPWLARTGARLVAYDPIKQWN
jgi:hypothetical protein